MLWLNIAVSKGIEEIYGQSEPQASRRRALLERHHLWLHTLYSLRQTDNVCASLTSKLYVSRDQTF